MAKPNVYELGSSPEIILAFTDQDDDPFYPSQVRLSIEKPDGTIFTVSGAGLSTTSISGAMTYIYNDATVKGWYSTEGWGKDGAGREIVKSHGFEISDILHNP